MALCLVGCGASRGEASRGEQVPLPTVETAPIPGCILMHEVVDVTAEPKTGALVLNGGTETYSVSWPKGFTAWRVGTQVEVLDAAGGVVLTTGARYSICPSEYLSGWVVGGVTPCPDCPLGFEVD
jgi:hypothetical protein